MSECEAGPPQKSGECRLFHPMPRRLVILLGLTGGCLFADPGPPASGDGDAQTSTASEVNGSTEPPMSTDAPTTEDTGSPTGDCTWEQVMTEPRPGKRSDAALALAPGGTEALLYGGRVGLLGPDLEDTWRFDGERWRLVLADVQGGGKKEQPGPRRGHAMAHDAARDRVLLFGGEYGGPNVKFADSTWIHDGSRWNKGHDGPSPRAFTALADLPHSAVVVLFGGRTDEGVNAETWTWNGQDWLQRDLEEAPSPRYGHTMILDGSGDVLLYGGCSELLCGDPLDDTWRFDGERWERLDTGAPEGLRSGGMVQDTARALTLRLGEGASWRWTGTTWSPADAAEPAVGHFALADLPGTGVVLFGGLTAQTIESDETWVLRCS